jgi:GNAT superfamily N-acetyltransferase
LRLGEEEAVSRLVARVFHRHVAPLFSLEGVEEFLRYIDPGAIHARLERNYFLLVATAGGQMVGAIAVRDYEHVSLLFVETAFQRQGIARDLLGKAVETCRTNKPDLCEIDVNSSPNAVPAYERLGFRQLGPEQIENGIRFVPMVMKLPRRDRVSMEAR